MIYSSCKDELRRNISGIQLEIQGTDASEVAYETFVEKCEKHSRA